MAMISNIRKNSWVLIVMIGLGLGGFVLMDMFSGQKSVFGSQRTLAGKVEGKNIDWNQFSRTENILYGNSSSDVYARRTALWNYFVEEKLIQDEAEALGLGVCKDELMDLQFGTNLSPIIQQRFQDPQTRQVSREQLNAIKEQIETNEMSPQLRQYWAIQENEIIKEKLQSKLTNMISKAIYTPTWMAEMMAKDRDINLDVAYVKVPFDEISNDDVELTDADFQAYYDENKSKYRKDEETRVVSYISFDVLPTKEDSLALKKEIEALVTPFSEASNDSVFVENNYGSFAGTFVTKSSLNLGIQDTIMNVPVGSTYGPYTEAGSYKVVKLIDKKIIADSADTRHILISANPSTPGSFEAASAKVDSLIGVLASGAASFDSLAIKFSQDPGSASKGGLYKNVTPNQFVPAYNEILFVTGEIGKFYKARTNYGVHLIEVLKRKGAGEARVKVAYINKAIIPSEATQNKVYNEVYQFIQSHGTFADLEKAAEEDSEMEVINSAPLKRNDYSVGVLGSSQASRDIVRWAFGDDVNIGVANEGSVSPSIYTYQDKVEYYNNKYVVAALKEIIPEGLPAWHAIRSTIELDVINRKKGEMIASKISSNDLASIASQFSSKIDTAANVSYGNGTLPVVGPAVKLLNELYKTEVNAMTSPVIENSGVYIAKVLRKNVPDNPSAATMQSVKMSAAQSVSNGLNFRMMQALRDNAEISDNRASFY